MCDFCNSEIIDLSYVLGFFEIHQICLSTRVRFVVLPQGPQNVWTGPERTRGNPRTSPGSSVAVVAFLLQGVVWYAVIWSARIVLGIRRRGHISCESLSFSLIRRCRLCFLLFFLHFLLGITVMFAPAVTSLLYWVVAILI